MPAALDYFECELAARPQYRQTPQEHARSEAPRADHAALAASEWALSVAEHERVYAAPPGLLAAADGRLKVWP